MPSDILPNLQEYLEVAKTIAEEAGKISRAASTTSKHVMSKSSTQDLVTETDCNVESLVKQLLMERFPEHRFIGEETHVSEDGIPLEPTWIVDPVDGTTNFVHGMPLFCIVIGLCIEREPVVGVVYNPVTKEMFSAAKGRGATLNGHPIAVSPSATTLSTSLIITEFTSKERAEATVRDTLNLMQHVRGIRMLGTAALGMSFTACGRADGFVERGIKCWDICAGTIIVREAGGYVTDYDGNQPFDLSKGEVIATTCQAVADEIVKLLK